MVRGIVMGLCLALSWSAASEEKNPWTLDSPVATADSWGYRPTSMNESTNPPAFVWGPEKEASRYHLQVATDDTFASPVYEIDNNPWSSHAPSVTLPEDADLWWRYRAWRKDVEWSAWSEARKFRVEPGAKAFPKPPADELIARLPVEHPRLFMRPEKLDALRRRTVEDLAPHWKDTLADAEAMLASPPDTSEPPKYPKGIEVKSEEWRSIWWGNREHAIAVTSAAATLAFAHRLNGDERFGKAAHDLMMAFVEWDPKGSTQYDYNDEAAMPLLYWPSRTYTWGYDLFTPEERERIVAVMRVRGADCFNHLRRREHLWEPYASHSNRAWHWLGEVAVVFHTEIPEAGQWLDFAMTVFHTCYPVWGGADGGWHEGSAYWVSYLSRFNYWAVAMKEALGIDAFTKPFFRETGYYGMYTLPPGATAGAWGDNAQGTTAKSIAEYVGFLAAVSGNSDWAWYATQSGFDLSKKGWFGLVAASMLPSAPEPLEPAQLAASRVFTDTGLAVFNTNLLDATANTQVHFKSSSWGTQSHGYNANNSFMVYTNGKPLLTLTGRRDIYGSPHHSKWMWHSKSDNAILFNGEGQRVHSAEAPGRIVDFKLSEDVDMLRGEAGEAFPNVERWTRSLYFLKPSVLLIHDRVESKEAGEWSWLLHSMAPFELAGDRATTRTESGSAEVRFLHPAGLQLSQTDQFDPPPHSWAKFKLSQWHLSAVPQKPMRKLDFVVAIVLNDADVKIEAGKVLGGHLVSTMLDDGRTYEIRMGRRAPLTAHKIVHAP